MYIDSNHDESFMFSLRFVTAFLRYHRGLVTTQIPLESWFQLDADDDNTYRQLLGFHTYIVISPSQFMLTIIPLMRTTSFSDPR